jgi:hypothetical protein
MQLQMPSETNLEGGILMTTAAATTATEEPNAAETLEQVKREVKQGFTSLAEQGFASMLAQRKELVLKLGKALEKVTPNKHMICNEIKGILKEEIASGLISARTIMNYCPPKWKREEKMKARQGSGKSDSDAISASENRSGITGVQDSFASQTKGADELSNPTTSEATKSSRANISVKLSRKDLCRIAGIVPRCREYGIVYLSPDGVLVDITPDTEIEKETGKKPS